MTASTLPTPAVAEAAPKEATASRYFEAEAVSLGPNTYLAYPHANIFGRDGRSFVFARTMDNGSDDVEFVWKEGPQGRETPLPVLKCGRTPKGFCYYDVARQTDLVAAMADDTLWVFEPGATAWRRLYDAPEGAALQHLPSVSADGSRVIFGQGRAPATAGEVTPPGSACIQVDTRTGAARMLFEQSWRANHFHFCPHDESWIGFSHEEWPEWKAGLPTIGDRMWAWHARHAPRGKFLFGGAQPDGTHINTGHERWGYSDTSALTVVYRSSTFDPKGIYEVWAQDRAPQLVSALRNFLHVDASRDGKWAVADTAGPFDPEEAPIPGDEGSRSDIVLVEKATGKTRLLARSHIAVHPYHVHPIISADNEWVLYNDSSSVLEGGAPGAVMVRTGVTP